MSKRLLKKKVFRLEDWKKASRIERMYIYMMEPDRFALNDPDRKYLNTLKRAFHIMSDYSSNLVASNLIFECFGEVETKNRVYKIMNDARDLFGAMIQRNKEFDRMVMKERLSHS